MLRTWVSMFQYCSRCFPVCCYSVETSEHSTVVSSDIFYSWGMWGSERVRNTSKVTQLVTDTTRIQPSSFWLKAPVLFSAAVPGKVVLQKHFRSQTAEFTLNPWKCFKPDANTRFKQTYTHSYFLCQYLLPDDWDTSDKTRLTYFNLLAGFWHTGDKKVYKGPKPHLHRTQ